MTELVPELEMTFELEIIKGRSFMEIIILADQLSKFGRTVEISTDTQDVKVYGHGGRTVAWISGTVQDRFVLYDAEEVTPTENRAIEAYASLPTGERK